MESLQDGGDLVHMEGAVTTSAVDVNTKSQK